MARAPFTKVAVVIFDRAPLFETSVPLSVFGVDRASSGAPRFELLAVAGEPGPLVTTAGIGLSAPHDLSALTRAEVVVVPTWRDPAEHPPRAALRAIRAAHERGATLLGLCLGAFVLAAAGVLDGRRVATHWFHARTLADQYPGLTVDPSVLFADDGDVITSAGTAAGIDACLHLVRSAHGAQAATAIARRMVVAAQRSGGQAQYIDQAVPDLAEGDDLDDALAYALAHLEASPDVGELADRASMSRRTFDRRFRARLGASPHQWLLQQRLWRAQCLLEETDMPMDMVATAAGFASAITMRPHFRRMTGVSPQAYRTAFRTQAP